MKKTPLGFSLIELMVTIAVAAVLLSIAVPSMRGVADKNRIESYQSLLMRDLSFAREEAINRNTRITVCKSADGATCAAVNDWDQGWIVFVDTAAGAAGTVDGVDSVLKVDDLGVTNDDLFSAENFISFESSGSLDTGTGATDATFVMCSADDQYIRGILVLASGRAIGSRPDVNGDHIVKDAEVLACP